MSFPITVEQACLIAIGVGSTVYVYVMIRASAKRLKPEPPNEANMQRQGQTVAREVYLPSPPPPPASEAPNAEQKQSRFKKLLRIDDTPIDKKVKQIASTQRQQAERCTKLDQQIRELKFAVAMKPDPKPAPTHISSRNDKRAQTEDAGWKKEQEGKSSRNGKHDEKEDAGWKEEQKGK